MGTTIPRPGWDAGKPNVCREQENHSERHLYSHPFSPVAAALYHQGVISALHGNSMSTYFVGLDGGGNERQRIPRKPLRMPQTKDSSFRLCRRSPKRFPRRRGCHKQQTQLSAPATACGYSYQRQQYYRDKKTRARARHTRKLRFWTNSLREGLVVVVCVFRTCGFWLPRVLHPQPQHRSRG